MIRRIIRGTPRKLVSKTSTNAAVSLTDAERQDSEGHEPTGCLISVDTNAVRISIDGTDPTQTGAGHKVKEEHGIIHLTSNTAVKNLAWISETADTHGEVQITLLY